MAKIDIPFEYADEAKKINEIFYKYDRSTTGNVSWTSLTSNTTYDTSESSDVTILNKGEEGLFKLLQSTFSGADSWLMVAKDINDINDAIGNITVVKRTTYSTEISTTWTGSSAPYTQDVTVTGITADDEPHIMPNYSTTNATAIAQKEAWAMVCDGTAGANKITFTCFEDKPTTAIPIQIEVMR